MFRHQAVEAEPENDPVLSHSLPIYSASAGPAKILEASTDVDAIFLHHICRPCSKVIVESEPTLYLDMGPLRYSIQHP